MKTDELEAKRYQDAKDRERLDDLTTVTPFKGFGEPAPNKAQHSDHYALTNITADNEREQHLIAEIRSLRSHADKLAEALRVSRDVLAERGIELKEITRALHNYESEVQP